MNVQKDDLSFKSLPKLGQIDIRKLWEPLTLHPIQKQLPILGVYIKKHDEWTEKIRIMGLDGGLLADYRILPGLDRLIEYIYSQSGWARPEIYVVSGMGRKGIDAWSAVSVVSHTKPVILLGTHLLEELDSVELAFILGHETGHLLSYTSEWKEEMSLSFLIRDFIEGNREEDLIKMAPTVDWRDVYRMIMTNCRTMEVRCDRLGLLLSGDLQKSARALMATALKSMKLAQQIDIHKYLSVQLPLLTTSPAAGPISVNAEHPYVPQRIKYLFDFVDSGDYDYFTRLFCR